MRLFHKLTLTMFICSYAIHDIAKGKKGDHSVNGSIIASTICPRLGLSEEETRYC